MKEITEDLLTFSGHQGRNLSILFVDNKKMTGFNRQFFGKNLPTNVISFSYMEEITGYPDAGVPVTEEIMGDIIISLEEAEKEAEDLSCHFYERVFALIIHGLLHITGYDHVNNKNEARRMRYRERKLLDFIRSHRLYKELTR